MLKVIGGFLAVIPVLVCGTLAEPNARGVAWGHFHFLTRDLEASKKFWTTLGATFVRTGSNDVYAVKNSLVLVRKAEPLGGSEATIVHHVGFKVKDLDGTLEKVRAAGYRVLQPADYIAKNRKCNVMGPDEINIELVADPTLDAAIASHHAHFYNDPIEETRAWYVKTFGAVPGKRDVFEAADVPGVNLSFSKPKGAVKPTKGYAFDHIGFEVKGLEAFCRALEASGIKMETPYTKIARANIAIAYIVDPFGTYIELTEGLDAPK